MIRSFWYQTPQQRRQAWHKARVFARQVNRPATLVLLFVIFILPFLFSPSLLLDLPAWLWWVRHFAWMGLFMWGYSQLVAIGPIAPAQVTGAAVEAMEQNGRNDGLVPFPARPVEQECPFFSRPLQIERLAQPVEAQCRQRHPGNAGATLQQRLRLPYLLPLRRLLPSSRSPEPSL